MKTKMKCPECKSANIKRISEDVYMCKQCYTEFENPINSNYMDLSLESQIQYFPNKNIMLKNDGIDVKFTPSGINGSNPTPKQKQFAIKLSNTNRMINKEINKKRIIDAKNMIEIFCHNLNLPEYITNETKKMFVNILYKHTFQGISFEKRIGAILLYLTRKYKILRDIYEISAVTGVEVSYIYKAKKKMLKFLNLKKQKITLSDYLNNIFDILSIPNKVYNTSLELLDRLDDSRKTKNKKILSCCIVWCSAMLNNMHINQGILSHINKVSGKSIRTMNDIYFFNFLTNDEKEIINNRKRRGMRKSDE